MQAPAAHFLREVDCWAREVGALGQSPCDVRARDAQQCGQVASVEEVGQLSGLHDVDPLKKPAIGGLVKIGDGLPLVAALAATSAGHGRLPSAQQ